MYGTALPRGREVSETKDTLYGPFAAQKKPSRRETVEGRSTTCLVLVVRADVWTGVEKPVVVRGVGFEPTQAYASGS
jgi:hypothetical protein